MKDNKRTIWIVVGIIGFLGICAVCMLVAAPLVLGGPIANVFNQLSGAQVAEQAGNNFLLAVKVGDYQTAYDSFEPALQNEIGGYDGFVSVFGGAGIESWDSKTVSVTTDDDRPGFALEGTISFTSAPDNTFQLVMVQQGDTYKVAGFTFTPIDQ